jgi:hypothetical protein
LQVKPFAGGICCYHNFQLVLGDEWIEDIETMGEKMDEYIDAQKTAKGFY